MAREQNLGQVTALKAVLPIEENRQVRNYKFLDIGHYSPHPPPDTVQKRSCKPSKYRDQGNDLITTF